MVNPNKLEARWYKLDNENIDLAVQENLGTPQGRKFLWWLLEIGRVGIQPYTGNALNTAFSCGELNVGQRILDRIISVSPEGYVSMMKENQSERSSRDEQLANARTDRAAGNGTADREPGEPD